MIFNLEVEKAIIGACLQAGEIRDISALDFHSHEHQWVWAAMIAAETPDVVTVSNELERVGHKVAVYKFLGEYPFWNIDKYAKEISELASRRRALDVASKIANDAHDKTKDINEIVADGTRGLDKLSTVSQKGREIAEAASDVMDIVLERIAMQHKNEKVDVGFQTGVGYIDRNLEGLKRKWIVYLAGSPGVGKSMLAFQMSLVFAKQAPGDYIALEMDEEGLMYRAYSMRTGYTPTDVEFGRVDSNKIIDAYNKFEDLPFNVFCPSRLSSHELKAYIAKQKAERDIGWVVVDYVSLLEIPSSRNKIEEDEHLSAELRKIASEFDILMVGLDSITKSGASGMLSLADVRGSFTKQHDADLSFGMSKYKAMNGLAPEVDIERMRSCRLLQILKDRHRGTADMIFPLELVDGLIDDLDKEEEIPGHWTEDL